MQAVDHINIGLDKEKFYKQFLEPKILPSDPYEAQRQINNEMEGLSSRGHVEIFAGTPENIEQRSELSRQSRRKLGRLEKKLNKKIAKQNT